jgi:hypothetical protein
VVVLIIAFSLRKKIKRNERGNEFFPWEREAAQGDGVLLPDNDSEESDEDGDDEEHDDEDDEYYEDDKDED